MIQKKNKQLLFKLVNVPAVETRKGSETWLCPAIVLAQKRTGWLLIHLLPVMLLALTVLFEEGMPPMTYSFPIV
jgi:hypothetical protein